MEDDENDVSKEAFIWSLVLVVIGCTAMGWMVGGDVYPRWSDAASGGVYGVCLYFGLIAIFSFQTNRETFTTGDLGRAVWQGQGPWILLTSVIVGWTISAGHGVAR